MTIQSPSPSPNAQAGGELSPASIRTRIVELSSQFERNVARATAAFGSMIEDPQRLAGIPPLALSAAQQAAARAGATGARLSLAPECYHAVLYHADDRKLRQELYQAHATRCSDRGPRAGEHDNSAVIQELLALRHQLARGSGAEDYAELALTRSALFTSTDEAERFLLAQAHAHKPRAQAQLEALWAFAKTQGVPKGFARWDLPYYAARRWQHESGCDASGDRAARDYFPLTAVCSGLQTLAAQLFDVRVSVVTLPAAEPTAARFALHSSQDEPLGTLEIVPAGAAADQLSTTQQVQLDAAASAVRLACGPALLDTAAPCLSPAQLSALCAAWGQGIVGLLQLRQHAGDKVAAALARQLAGSLAVRIGLEPLALEDFAQHDQSGQPLPAELRDHFAALGCLHGAISRQDSLERALFELRVHRDYVPADKATGLRSHVLDTLSQVRREIGVLPPSYWERMPNTARDIFGAEGELHTWDEAWVEHAADLLAGAHQSDNGLDTAQLHTLWLARDVSSLRTALTRLAPSNTRAANP